MNAIKEFIALRPDVEPLTSGDEERLWRRIVSDDSLVASDSARVPGVTPTSDSASRPVGAIPSTLDFRHSADEDVPTANRARRRWALAGAAASLIVGVAAIAVFAGSPDEAAPTQAPTDPSVLVPSSTTVPVADRVPEPPAIDIAGDGWVLDSYTDEITAGNGAGTPSSVLVPVDSLDRWIRFTELPENAPPQTTVELVPGEHLTTTGVTSGGTVLAIDGWGYDVDTFTTMSDEVLAGGVPDGHVFLSAADAEQFNRLVVYRFTDEEFDDAGAGRLVQVVITGGGGANLPDGAVVSTEFEPTDPPPETGLHLATAVRGFWSLNVVGEGFDSDAELLGVLDGLAVIDEDSERAAAVERAEHVQAQAEAHRDAETQDSSADVTVSTAVAGADFATTTISTVPAGAVEATGPRAQLDVEGWELTAADTGDGLTTGAEYRFLSTDGRTLQINFHPGEFADRVANEFAADAVDVLGEFEQVATYPDGRRFRYDVQLADFEAGGQDQPTMWVMEVDGEPFADQAEFMALVERITVGT